MESRNDDIDKENRKKDHEHDDEIIDDRSGEIDIYNVSVGDESIDILPDLSFESNEENMDVVLAPSTSGDNVKIKVTNEKKARNKFSWLQVKCGEDLDEAIDAIIDEGFKLYDDSDLKCGQKFYFRCGKVPKNRKFWCNKRYIIFLPSNNNDIITLSNGFEHNHNELLESQKRAVSDEMTSFIFDFYKCGTTIPSAVLAHIRMARQKFNLFKDDPDPHPRQLEYIQKKYNEKDVKPM